MKVAPWANQHARSILFLLAAVLGILGLAKIKKGTPPVPEHAIREARLTTEALKSDGR